MKKWMVIYNGHIKAAEKLCAAIQPYLNYVPVCERNADSRYNAIELRMNPEVEGLHISVSESDGETQSVLIEGQDEAYLLYGVADFKNIYLPYAREAGCHCPVYYFNSLFEQPLKPYDYQTKARISRRGIWLWGYTIYDYRRFIDNMVDLKLNTLIIWNDFPPINIEQVIEYAHENHVKIYLGFAWGWDTSMPKSITEEFCQQVAATVLETYRTQYAHLACDGIYFQSFTEYMPEELGGVSVAEAVVGLVNEVGGKLLEEYEDLQILFGLHADCALPRLDAIQKTDSRISIIWEDVGAFPYHYMPHQVEDFEKTKEHTRKIRDLRDGGFGVVLKGVICLDWSTFQHQKGAFAMGVSNRKYTAKKAGEKREILRHIQAWWLKNTGYAKEMIQEFNEDTMVTCLVEDSLLEEMINLPTALYAAMLWDSDRAVEDIIFEVCRRTDVEFV